jgi:hypothetical protein
MLNVYNKNMIRLYSTLSFLNFSRLIPAYLPFSVFTADYVMTFLIFRASLRTALSPGKYCSGDLVADNLLQGSGTGSLTI